MRFDLRSLFLITLFTGAVACGDDSSNRGGGGDGGSASSTTGTTTSSSIDCSCEVTIDSDTRVLTCVESACLGNFEAERWTTCTENGPVFSTKNCVAHLWEHTTLAPMDCDGQRTCPADSYCVFHIGPEPRTTECRPIPPSCLRPVDARALCGCLEADALTSVTCSDATTGAACSAFPDERRIGCN